MDPSCDEADMAAQVNTRADELDREIEAHLVLVFRAFELTPRAGTFDCLLAAAADVIQLKSRGPATAAPHVFRLLNREIRAVFPADRGAPPAAGPGARCGAKRLQYAL